MQRRAKLTREQAEEVARNIEAQGGNASELRDAMAKTQPIRRVTPPIPGLVEQAEGPRTPVAAFWEIYHSLETPVVLSGRGSAIKEKILAFAKEQGLSISPTRDIDRFSETLARVPVCPWGKEECICYNVREGQPCKGGLLVK